MTALWSVILDLEIFASTWPSAFICQAYIYARIEKKIPSGCCAFNQPLKSTPGKFASLLHYTKSRAASTTAINYTQTFGINLIWWHKQFVHIVYKSRSWKNTGQIRSDSERWLRRSRSYTSAVPRYDFYTVITRRKCVWVWRCLWSPHLKVVQSKQDGAVYISPDTTFGLHHALGCWTRTEPARRTSIPRLWQATVYRCVTS